jgi:predicted GH43/DUF377 family glycosyl hydrolase
MSVTITRKDVSFYPDPSRVIARFLYTGDERSLKMIQRILEMPEELVKSTLTTVLRDFTKRHRNISKVFENHFEKVAHLFQKLDGNPDDLSLNRKILIGSYFTMEYSIESAAFFNPSMVEHPDQSELGPEEKRVILSFRATGEGHISSLVFRAGVLDKDNMLTLEEAGQMLDEAQVIKRFVYNKGKFMMKLDEMQKFNNVVPPALVLNDLGDEFTFGDLKRCVDKARKSLELSSAKELLLNEIMWLANSHYEIDFSLDTALSERVIFPISESERNGIEDARFVMFTEDDGTKTYYATYTAYDGMTIMPKLITTSDFYHFKVLPIHGEIAQNKGMALFPRKIKGRYAMLCRIDGINNYIAFSDNIGIWRKAELLQEPRYPWELIQIGNAGSPVETGEGWLVITHAVGPMREYVLGAALYDLDDPTKEMGRLKEPLLIPNKDEREGYVPNVVYSCGSILHNEELIIPYAMSDFASTYAIVNLKELLGALKNST